VACAAALAVIDVMQRECLPDRAARIGARLTAGLTALARQHPPIGDVRGLGAMVAIELVKDPATKEPDKALTGRLLAEALKRGLLLLSAGTYGNVVRILVPLSVDDATLDEGLDVLGEALSAAGS